MTSQRSVAAAFFLFCSCLPVFGWGPIGHRVVGRIAERHLTKRADHSIKVLLGQDTLAEVGTWADEIRSDPKWDKAAPWHYVSVEDHETYQTTQKDPQGDVIEAIERFRKTLRNSRAPREERAVAVKFLVHFIGDLHQPLHVGRRQDRGGNSIQVTWFRGQVNLHQVWDSGIIETERLSFSEFADFLDEPNATEIDAWRSTGVADWAKESFDYRAAVYDVGDGKLGYPYAARHMPFVKMRLIQAGIRLSGILNSVLK